MRHVSAVAAVGLVVVTVSVLSAAAGPQGAALGELPVAISDDAAVIFALESTDALKSSLREFAAVIDPDSAEGADGLVDEAVLSVFRDTLIADEISGSRPLFVVMYPGDDGYGGSLTAIAYFPLADFEALRARLSDSIKKDEASGLEYIEQKSPFFEGWDEEDWETEDWESEEGEEDAESGAEDLEDPDELEGVEALEEAEEAAEGGELEYPFEDVEVSKVFFRRAGAYLLLSSVPDRLAPAAEAAPLSEARRENLLRSMSGGPLCVNVSFPALRRAFPDLGGDLRSEMKADLPAAGEPDAEMLMATALTGLCLDVLQDVMDGCDELFATMAAGGDGIRIASTLSTVPGSKFAAIFAEQGVLDPRDLSLLPSGPAFAWAGGLRGEETWAYLKAFYANALAAMAPDEEAATAARAAVEDALAKVESLGVAEHMAGSLMVGPGGFRTVNLYRTSDAPAAAESIASLAADSEWLSIWGAFAGSAGTELTPVVTQEVIEGVNVTAVTVPLDFLSANPMVGAMLQQIFGGALVTRTAAREGFVINTLSPGPELMAEMLKSPEQRADVIDKGKIDATLQGRGAELSGIALVSIPDYVAAIMSMVPMFGMPAPAEPPAADRFACIGYGFREGTMSLFIEVPVQQITATQEFVKSMQPAFAPAEGPSGDMRTANLKQLGLGIGMYQADNDEMMPPDLQTLLDQAYVKNELLFMAPAGYSAEFDKAAVDATGDYYYARVKAPLKLADPSEVPIMWEKMSDDDGTVAALWADLRASVLSTADLSAAVTAALDLYEKPPRLPAEATDFPVDDAVEATP